MATGAGLGGLITAALPLIGIITLWQARRKRKAGPAESRTDSDFVRRQAETMETERRMASYLAGRDAGRHYGASGDENGQENGR